MSSSPNTTSPDASANATSPDASANAGPNCGSINNQVTMFGLRVGSLFVILVTSLGAALFPVLTRRTKLIHVPHGIFEFAKYFGSGVIIATAFIHLLSPAVTALSNPCLTGTWTLYPWPLAISMASVFGIFFIELVAFRWGSAKLAKLGIKAPSHHGHALEVENGAEAAPKAIDAEKADSSFNDEPTSEGVLDEAISQILGIFILEFGVLFHSVLIGLTLAVDPNFKVLFVVLVFHQMFEGLGLGARLAYMPLPPKYNYVPIVGGLLYGLTTPVGIAAGLGIRSSYNPASTTASIVSGTFDSISSGILLYTGLVELLAHEFLFNPSMHKASTGRLVFASVCMISGAGIMSLLGRWA